MFDLLNKKIKEKNAPVVIGLDPMIDYLPSHLIKKALENTENPLSELAEAFYSFNKEIIDSTFDLIPAIKLQSAMYEQLGIDGAKTLQKTIQYGKQKGLIVMVDAKRADIGSTSKAYSTSFLGKLNFNEEAYPIYDCDIITVNPYLGIDGIKPFIEDCNQYNKGIFILCKTSNPSSDEYQNLVLKNDLPLYHQVALNINQYNNHTFGEKFKKVGAVVGATYPKEAKELRSIMPNIFFLVPGYGAQGASGKDLIDFFDKFNEGAIISASRSIMCAYKNDHTNELDFGLAARNATISMIEDINHYLPKK